jgi:hypothetical protein
MKSTSRQAGWSAAANSKKAREAFDAWKNGETLDVRTLTLTRDFAVLHCKGARVVNAINRALRVATINAVNSR